MTNSQNKTFIFGMEWNSLSKHISHRYKSEDEACGLAWLDLIGRWTDEEWN